MERITHIQRPKNCHATQWNSHGDHPHVVRESLSPSNKTVGYLLHLGQQHEVLPGDWIVESEDGNILVIKNDRFQAEYEDVQDIGEKSSALQTDWKLQIAQEVATVIKKLPPGKMVATLAMRSPKISDRLFCQREFTVLVMADTQADIDAALEMLSNPQYA